MGDHDDEAVLRHLGKDVHDLDAGLRVESARGLVRKYDLRVVHEGAGDGHPLHLATGELRRTLVDVVAQAHALERGTGTLATLLAANTRQRERELDVLENRLVRDKVVALEHEADAVVAIGVPVGV